MLSIDSQEIIDRLKNYASTIDTFVNISVFGFLCVITESFESCEKFGIKILKLYASSFGKFLSRSRSRLIPNLFFVETPMPKKKFRPDMVGSMWLKHSEAKYCLFMAIL
jgi:hypothetical protein